MKEFGLILTITHDCNLRCSYCYAGRKSARVMDQAVARHAIDCAIASLSPAGKLHLSFFGGEPLLEPRLIEDCIEYATGRAAPAGITLGLSITTSGTCTDPAAWRIMTRPELELAVSCDGTAGVHDRHRRRADGGGSHEMVVATMRRLLEAGKSFRAVMVVRPDTLDELADGIRFLHGIGVRYVDPVLDLWARWSEQDIERLEKATTAAAAAWRDGLPWRGIGCFDEKAVKLARLPLADCVRCGFGRGEVAVAPSGRIYPCERLVGDDDGSSPMVLGQVSQCSDFLSLPAAPGRSDPQCDGCEMVGMCTTYCRCGNYVRTGDVRRPDLLLCTWNQACLTQTAEALHALSPEVAGDAKAGEP